MQHSLRNLLLALLFVIAQTRSTRATPELRCTSLETPLPCALMQGERAPFRGELWPSEFARLVLEDLLLGRMANTELEFTQKALAAEKVLRTIERDEAKALLEAESDARQKSEALARQLVQAPRWYERPAFLIPATAAVTFAFVIGLSEAFR